jgi:hypothetical protein
MFVRGPKDILVPDSRVGPLLAYIHNNPVRAGVVSSAEGSTWTSHRSYVELARVPPWLAVSEGLERAGLTRLEFRDLVGTSTAHPVLGEVTSDEHLEELVDAYERERLAEDKPVNAGLDAHRVVAAIADVMGIPMRQLRSRRRGDVERRARAAAISCGQRLGCTSTALADALGVTPQYVNKQLRASLNNKVAAEMIQQAMQKLVNARD